MKNSLAFARAAATRKVLSTLKEPSLGETRFHDSPTWAHGGERRGGKSEHASRLDGGGSHLGAEVLEDKGGEARDGEAHGRASE